MTRPPDPPADARARRRSGLTGAIAAAVVAGYALVGALLYRSVLHGWFVGDDLEEIPSAGPRSIRSTESLHPGRNLRPLTRQSLALNDRVGGLDPWGYHVTNLALHIAASALVALLTAELYRSFRPDPLTAGETRRRSITSIAAGAVFLVMPNHTEAVSWISGRGDLGATCFALVAVIAWLRTTSAAGPRRLVWMATSVGSMGVALGFKESAIVVSALVSTIELARDVRRPLRAGSLARAVLRPWPLHLGIVAYLVVRVAVLGTLKDGSLWEEFVGDSIPARLLRQAALTVRAWMPAMGTAGWIAIALVSAVGACGVTWLARRGPADPEPWVRLSAACAAATAVAAIPVGHLGVSAVTTGGERLVYLGSAFAAAAMASVGAAVVRARPPAAALAAVLLGVSMVMVVQVNRRWVAASELAESIVDQMQDWPHDRQVYLLNAPDTLDGVYVLRNEVAPAAVLVHGWDDPPPIDVIAETALSGPDARVDVRSPRAGVWRLRLTGSHVGFHAVAGRPDTWGLDGVTVERLSPDELEITFGPAARPGEVWFVSEGTLRNAGTARP